jgi:hypothetical protein
MGKRRPGGIFWITAGLFLIPIIACGVLGVAAAARQPQLIAGLPLISARVSGTVYGEDAAQREAGRVAMDPLAGATVTCGQLSVTTNSKGYYSLGVTRGGSPKCSVSAPHYTTMTVSLNLGSGGGYTLNFGAAAATTSGGGCSATQSGENCGALALQPGAIGGVALDSHTQQPINSAQVTCWDNSQAAQISSNAPARYIGLADASGQYVITNVPVGPYLCVSGVSSTTQPVVARPDLTATLDFSVCQSAHCPGVYFHDGSVLHTLNLYLIFWTPPGSRLDPDISNARAEALYEQFVNDLGGSRFYGLLTQYWDYTGPVRNVVHLGGTYTDTRPYPHAGTQSSPLRDADITDESSKVINRLNWPVGQEGAAVAVITAYGAEECAGNPLAESDCTFSTNGAGFCAYHAYIDAPVIGVSSTVPYLMIPNVPECATLPTGRAAPYGAEATDSAINSLSHEIFESVSDPSIDGWFGSAANDTEIGDLCVWQFGFPKSDGSTVTLAHGHGYALQMEWSAAAGACSYG